MAFKCYQKLSSNVTAHSSHITSWHFLIINHKCSHKKKTSQYFFEFYFLIILIKRTFEEIIFKIVFLYNIIYSFYRNNIKVKKNSQIRFYFLFKSVCALYTYLRREYSEVISQTMININMRHAYQYT